MTANHKASPQSHETEARKPDVQDAPVPLVHAFSRLMRVVMREEEPIAELDALPMAQLRLLWTVNFSHEATMKDFSERLNVSQSTLTQLADKLVRRGLVERQADAHDRRVVRLHMSEAGANLLRRAQNRQQSFFGTLWHDLAPEARSAVMNGLDTLCDAGEAYWRAKGVVMPDFHDPSRQQHERNADDTQATQPVVDLMVRRVRGRQTGRDA